MMTTPQKSDSSPDPDPQEAPEPQEPPKPQEAPKPEEAPKPQEAPKLQEVKAVKKLSEKELMIAEVAKIFSSGWTKLGVPSVDEIRKFKSEWQSVRSSRFEMIDEFSRDHEERKAIEPKAELEKAQKAKERTKQVLAERKIVSISPAACIACKKPIGDSDTVLRNPDYHLLHSECESVNDCPTCTAEGSQVEIPVGRPGDLMIIVGHGFDNEDYTFVPAGMTVYTFAQPGVGLPFEEGALALINPTGATKAMTFEQGSPIPNMEVEELTEAQGAAMRNVFGYAGGRPGDVNWVSGSQQLCTYGRCKPPIHACDGLLTTYRGTKNLYLVACAGDAEPDEYSAEAEGNFKLMALITAKAEESPAKAVSYYNSLSKVKQAILQLNPKFVKWYDETLSKL